MNYDAQEFGRRVQELRREQKITQEKMAEDLNLAKNSISRIERGERSCSIDLMVEVAAYLNTTTDYLLTGKREICRNSVQTVIGELAGLSRSLTDLVTET